MVTRVSPAQAGRRGAVRGRDELSLEGVTLELRIKSIVHLLALGPPISRGVPRLDGGGLIGHERVKPKSDLANI